MLFHVLIIQYILYISIAINYKYCDNENIKQQLFHFLKLNKIVYIFLSHFCLHVIAKHYDFYHNDTCRILLENIKHQDRNWCKVKLYTVFNKC